MAESNIITGQFVHISQSPASFGERLLAQLIDLFLLFCYVSGITLLLERVSFPALGSGYFLVLCVYLPALCYSLLMEVFNHGQSVGKLVMRLRVVKKDGTTPGLGDFVMRWLLQTIDMGFFMIGVLVMLFTKDGQRLGDLAAGTMVIRLGNYRKVKVSLDEFAHLDPHYQPVYPEAENLSLNQLDVIRRTLDSDDGPDRDRRVAALARKVRELLEIPATDGTADEQLLRVVERDGRGLGHLFMQ